MCAASAAAGMPSRVSVTMPLRMPPRSCTWTPGIASSPSRAYCASSAIRRRQGVDAAVERVVDGGAHAQQGRIGLLPVLEAPRAGSGPRSRRSSTSPSAGRAGTAPARRARASDAYRKPVPRGPRRNFRPVADTKSAPISATSTGSWPMDWQASTMYQVSVSSRIEPMAATSLTRPFCDGQCVTATIATSLSSMPPEGVDVDGAVVAVRDELDPGAVAHRQLHQGQDVGCVLGGRDEDAVAGIERPGEGDRRRWPATRRRWRTRGGRSGPVGAPTRVAAEPRTASMRSAASAWAS